MLCVIEIAVLDAGKFPDHNDQGHILRKLKAHSNIFESDVNGRYGTSPSLIHSLRRSCTFCTCLDFMSREV
jgi:hypothetical protein